MHVKNLKPGDKFVYLGRRIDAQIPDKSRLLVVTEEESVDKSYVVARYLDNNGRFFVHSDDRVIQVS